MPSITTNSLSVYDSLPPTLRAICRGERTDLTPEQLAPYEKHCQRCRTPIVTPQPAKRITPNPPKPPASHGLGDAVASALATFGITPERVTAFIGAPCGCAERKAKLNAIGNWMSSWLSGSKEPPPVP